MSLKRGSDFAEIILLELLDLGSEFHAVSSSESRDVMRLHISLQVDNNLLEIIHEKLLMKIYLPSGGSQRVRGSRFGCLLNTTVKHCLQLRFSLQRLF